MLSAMKLHSYFRSSVAFRVRIALELKSLNYACMVLSAFQKAPPSAWPDSRALA